MKGTDSTIFPTCCTISRAALRLDRTESLELDSFAPLSDTAWMVYQLAYITAET
jgi:hypothetical protein